MMKKRWVLVYILAVILGLVVGALIAMGALDALGLWPEGWRF